MANASSILSSAAYILFYQRRDFDSSFEYQHDDSNSAARATCAFNLPSADILWPQADLVGGAGAATATVKSSSVSPGVTEVVRINCDWDPLSGDASSMPASTISRKRTNSGSMEKLSKVLGVQVEADSGEGVERLKSPKLRAPRMRDI